MALFGNPKIFRRRYTIISIINSLLKLQKLCWHLNQLFFTWKKSDWISSYLVQLKHQSTNLIVVQITMHFSKNFLSTNQYQALFSRKIQQFWYQTIIMKFYSSGNFQHFSWLSSNGNFIVLHRNQWKRVVINQSFPRINSNRNFIVLHRNQGKWVSLRIKSQKILISTNQNKAFLLLVIIFKIH